MNPFDLLEKLINEHGSATVLREQLGLAKAEYAALERKHADLKAEQAALQAELEEVKLALQDSQARARLGDVDIGTHRCDHCNGGNLTRTGARPHRTFGAVGVKEGIFKCADCGRDTFIELKPGW